MFRPAIWIYVILLALAGFLVFEVVQVWNRSDAGGVRETPQVVDSTLRGVKEGTLPRPAPEAQATPQSASGGQEPGLKSKEAYQIVSVKNPFRPSRTDWEGAGRHVGRPKIYLYGVTLAGEYQSALLAMGPVGKGRGARLYRLGDQVGGYTLKEIGADRVSLALGEDVFTVLLHDTAKPKVASSAPPVQAGAQQPPSPPTVQPPAPPRPMPDTSRKRDQLERFRRLQTEPGSTKSP